MSFSRSRIPDHLTRVYGFTRRKNNLNKVKFNNIINKSNYKKSENYSNAVTSLRSNLTRYLGANYKKEFEKIYQVIQTQDKEVSKQQLLDLQKTVHRHFVEIYEKFQDLLKSFPIVDIAPYRYVLNPAYPMDEMMEKGPLIYGNTSITRIAIESRAHMMDSYNRASTNYQTIMTNINHLLDWLSPDYQARMTAKENANANARAKAKANANARAKEEANKQKRKSLIKNLIQTFPPRNYSTKKNKKPSLTVIPDGNETNNM
jgi:hypothetical protein